MRLSESITLQIITDVGLESEGDELDGQPQKDQKRKKLLFRRREVISFL